MVRPLRFALLIAVFAGLGLVSMPPATAAQPSTDVLKAAALRTDDLPRGFQVITEQDTSFSAGPLEIPLYQIVFGHPLRQEAIQVALVGYAPALGDDFITPFLEGISRVANITLTPADPPQADWDIRRYTAEVPTPGGGTRTGDALLWQEGEVVVWLLTVGSDLDTALGYASIVQDRLLTGP